MGGESNDDIISDSQESSPETTIYGDGNQEVSISSKFSLTQINSDNNDEAYNQIDSPEVINQVTTIDSQENPITNDYIIGQNTSTSLINRQITFEREDTAPRRMLRKRTAIQKMPYSLERIKHRQLLEGYDVSTFDIISNQVDLSVLENKINKTDIINTKINGNVVNNDDIYTNDNTSDYDSKIYEDDSDVYSEYSNHSLQKEDDDINIETQYDLDEEIPTLQKDFCDSTEDNVHKITSSDEAIEPDILFRGKKLKIKTGYRGVLPKMLWERQLSTVEKRTTYSRRTSPPKDGKGVAKKKKVITQTGQDVSLLKELIVDTNEENNYHDDVTKNFEVYHQNPTDNEVENLSLINLDKYYHNKYDNYISDSSLKYELDETGRDDIDKDDFTHTGAINDIYTIDDLEESSLIGNELYPSSDDDMMIVEDNRSELNPLLNVIERGKENLIKNKVTKKSFLMKGKSVKRKGKITKMGQKNIIQRISIKSYKRSSPIILNNKKSYQDILKEEENNESDVENKTEKKNHKSKKYFANRKVVTYNTVVEALTGQFRSKSHKGRRSDEGENVLNEVVSIVDNSPLEVLDVFFKKTSLVPPDNIVILLNNKTYTLSRFNSDKIESTMKTIFDCIINEGSSEESLLTLSKQLTNFLWQLNIPSIRVVIEEFHANFREKLNSLGQKARSIHFYVLAVCQLMLLEVTKYGNIALIYKEKIKRTILNHVVSLFSTLSICYEKINKENIDLLNQSYDILATIIDELKLKKQLWYIFNEKCFGPDVVRVLCNIFPIKTPQWAAIKIENDFNGLKKALSLISYCHYNMHWDIETSIILKLHDIFKGRRFNDFEEEGSSSKINKVCINPEMVYACKTVFNQYLFLINYMSISNIMLEKLTPISRMTINDTPSALINRLNLLVLLAHISNLNYANRFQLFITQLIEIKFVNDLNLQDRMRISEAILNSVIFFLLDSVKKNVAMKYSIIPMIYEDMILSCSSKKPLWISFLTKIRQVVNNHKDIWNRLSKALFKCGITTDDNKVDKELFSLFLDIYLENLENTDSKWIFANLFPLVRNKAQLSVDWIYAYCKVGRSLIAKGELNWWQFVTFHSLESSPEIRFYFNCEVLELCDNISFKNLEKEFYSVVVDNIDSSMKNKSFWRLCKRLLQKSENNVVNFNNMGTNIVNYSPFWKRLFEVMGRLKYSDLIISLTRKLAEMYFNGMIESNCSRDIVVFLDSKFINYLQDISQFNRLRKVFQISNQEIENNNFRKAINALPDIIDQVIFMEQSILNANFDDVIEKKIISLFSTTNEMCNLNPYRLIVTTIVGNYCDSLTPTIIFKNKMKISNFLLSILLKVNFKKFYQVKENEYLELFRLAHFIFITYGFKDTGTKKPYVYATFMKTSLQFFLHMVDISMGFDESSLLSQFSTYNSFAAETKIELSDVDVKTLCDKVDTILINSTNADNLDADDALTDSDTIENTYNSLNNILSFSL
ncbi:Mms22p PWA37_002184 [Arxiozyma heterogenica]|uniref:Mms22p n=1 Tax=Arxiozyma heterogenica TaxID=278026 RepID=UPI002F1A2962